MPVFHRPRLVERSLLTLGIGLVLAAIVGGGLDVAGFEVPLVSSVVRQILLAVLGIAVAVLSLWVKSDEAPEKPVPDNAPHVTRTRPRGLVAAMPTEVVVDQPTEVWVQVCLTNSSGFVASLPQYTSSGEEIGKSDARFSPGSVQFTEREGRLMDAVLSVAVTSPYFRVVNGTRTINLSPRHDSAKLVFQVVPSKVVPRARVFVSVTQQQDGASVTVAEVSVTARVIPSGKAVEVPPPASTLWNVAQQGIVLLVGKGIGFGDHARVEPPPPPFEIGVATGPAVPRSSERAVGVDPASEPLPQSAHAKYAPQPAPRRWLLLVAVGVSFAVVAFVIWKLLG